MLLRLLHCLFKCITGAGSGYIYPLTCYDTESVQMLKYFIMINCRYLFINLVEFLAKNIFIYLQSTHKNILNQVIDDDETEREGYWND